MSNMKGKGPDEGLSLLHAQKQEINLAERKLPPNHPFTLRIRSDELQGVSKKCPEYKIASELVYLQNYGYQRQPTANIGLQVCISVNLFSYVQFCKQGESSKCFTFKWLAHKNFKRKMIFFCAANKYGMLLSICKNLRRNDT